MAGHYWLTDICQQAINIVSSKAGSSAVTQSNLMLKPDKLSDVGVCMCVFPPPFRAKGNSAVSRQDRVSGIGFPHEDLCYSHFKGNLPHTSIWHDEHCERR